MVKIRLDLNQNTGHHRGVPYFDTKMRADCHGLRLLFQIILKLLNSKSLAGYSGSSPRDGMVVAHKLRQVGSVEPLRLNQRRKKGEGENVVDNYSGARGVVVDWSRRPYWRWIDTSATRCSARGFRY
jgi:hypothetical protein